MVNDNEDAKDLIDNICWSESLLIIIELSKNNGSVSKDKLLDSFQSIMMLEMIDLEERIEWLVEKGLIRSEGDLVKANWGKFIK